MYVRVEIDTHILGSSIFYQLHYAKSDRNIKYKSHLST